MTDLWEKQLLFNTQVSIAVNAVMAISKIVIGILTFSLFMCVNAFYNIGIGLAKYQSLTGIKKTEHKDQQYSYCAIVGTILLITSVVYIIYSLRLFAGAKLVFKYPMEVGIAIATFTFVEIGMNIKGTISARKHPMPLISAIKQINLASSLICLVLTQTALMSFAHDGDSSVAVGITGVLFGTSASIIGIVLIIRMSRIKKKINYKEIEVYEQDYGYAKEN